MNSFAATFLLGFPHIFSLSGEYFAKPDLSYAGGLGAFSVNVSESEFNVGNLEGRMRWHPWDGSFIVGGILGVQSVTGSASKTFSDASSGAEVPVKFSLEISSLYFTPHFGWLWRFDGGLVLGLELGYQLPFGVSSTFEVTALDPSQQAAFERVQATQPYRRLESSIENFGDRLGKIPFPYVTAVRIGWSF